MSREEQLDALIALLPSSEGFLPTRRDSELAKLLGVTAAQLAGVQALAVEILAQLDPRAPGIFLEDFERNLGIPDCGELAPTTAERVAVVVEKYTRRGDLSVSSLVEACALLGYAVTINENPTVPTDFEFEVEIVGPLPVTYFRAGVSRAGDSLGSFGDAALLCVLDKRKPAHSNYRLVVV